jgi:hypothetical protein
MRWKARRCARLMAVMLAFTACSQADDESPGPGVMTWDAAAIALADAGTSPPALAGGAAGAGGAAAGTGGATLGGPAGGGTTGAAPGPATTGATAGGATTGAMSEGGTPGGATPGGGPVGVQPAPDAGAPGSGAPPVLTLPSSSVPCGGSPCDTLANVCCESWSTTGFGAQQSCVASTACNRMYSRDDPAMNRVVPHTCDGKEDCPAGQICCFIADGRPICDFADILECNAKVTGPGGGRICTEADKCVLGALAFIGEGVPLGVLSCNDDSDCQARAGTSCQPEQDNTVTTGRGVAARSYVKVCR